MRTNDRLSYYDFGQFLNQAGIKLNSWEKEALFDRLDRLSLAFIEFSEFNEFTSAYGIDWGVHILENDIEARLDKELNLSYKDYKVTKKDYFNGCKTILTSEKAALSMCSKIYQDNRQKQK